MATESPPAADAAKPGRLADHAFAREDALAAAALIAHVLRRTHETAMTLNSPDEARAILHVARSFADELATMSPGFDRLCFINAATGLGSPGLHVA